MTDARIEALVLMSTAWKPARSVGTTKPRTRPSPPSSRAHTIATSAREPLVIQRLTPWITQSSPTRRQRVRIAPGSLPASGSVSPKQPTASPDARRGSQASLTASDAHRWMGYITRLDCTLTKLRRPESTYSTSRLRRPYAVALAPAPP